MKMDRAAVMAALANGQKTFDQVDFSTENLSNLGFFSTTFKDCIFLLANILESQFADCDFRACDMGVATMRRMPIGATFRRCTMTGCNFESARLGRTVFDDCMLDQIRLGGARLENTIFEQCFMSNSHLATASGTLAMFDDTTTFKNCTHINTIPQGLRLFVPHVVKAPTFFPPQPPNGGWAKLPPIQIGDAAMESEKELSRQELKVLNMQTTRRTCARCAAPLRGTLGFTYCPVCEKD